MRDRSFLIRALAGLLSLVLLLAGVVGLAAPASAGLTGSASGTVTGPDGQPLADVDVILYQLIDGEGYRVDVIQTEADGTYRFDGLYPAFYWLGFHSADYIDEWWDDATDLSDATGFTVSMDQVKGGLDAQLAPAGHIAGTVTDPDGQPIPDIYVSADVLHDGSWGWGPPHGATTGTDGTYDIGSLPPGTYRLEFADYYSTAYLGEYWDDAADIGAATDIEVIAGETAGGRDAELAVRPGSTGHVGGTVTGPVGKPLAAIAVRAYRQDGDQWVRATGVATDELGRYDLDLSPGAYLLQFQDPSGAYVDEYWDDAPSAATATPIQVGPRTDLTDVSPRLAARVIPLTSGPVPTIVGTPRVGKRLTASVGSWAPATTTTRVQWLLDGVAVPGATGTTYTPTAADVGKLIQVRVTGSASGFTPTTTESRQARVRGGTLRMAKAPSVRGAVRRGAILTVSPGSWKPVRPTLHWRWFAGGRHVASADDRPLRLRGRIAKRLSGKAIAVRFSVTATGYESLAMKVRVRGRLR